MLYVVSYDIPKDKMRTKISKELENYGVRIQYSVFECELTQARFQKRYEKLVVLSQELEGGSIRVYRICDHCKGKIITIGEPLHKVELLTKDTIIIPESVNLTSKYMGRSNLPLI